MSVKVRLMRIGAKKRPFYRIVAVDERNKRNGRYIELIGTYNPLTEPKEININKPLLEKWTKQGAVLSHGFLRITKQAPQKPPRKPKKEKLAVSETKPASVPEPESQTTENSQIQAEEKPEDGKSQTPVKQEGDKEAEKPEESPKEA